MAWHWWSVYILFTVVVVHRVHAVTTEEANAACLVWQQRFRTQQHTDAAKRLPECTGSDTQACIKVSCGDDSGVWYVRLESSGIPDHPTGADNGPAPTPLDQNYDVKIALFPNTASAGSKPWQDTCSMRTTFSTATTGWAFPKPSGPPYNPITGFTLNGVAIFSPLNAPTPTQAAAGCSASADPFHPPTTPANLADAGHTDYAGTGYSSSCEAEAVDRCVAHPAGTAATYHYHMMPRCMYGTPCCGNIKRSSQWAANGYGPIEALSLEGFDSRKAQGLEVIGIAFDGHPIYGPYDAAGQLHSGLDSCNGKFDKDGKYGYYATTTFPYLVGCFGPGVYNDDTMYNVPFCTTAATPVGSAPSVPSTPDTPVSDGPNVVMFLVDDLGWNDVGWASTDLGSMTPNIDRLAAAGIKLNHHYAQPVCTPSRAALLTGRYPIRYGLQGEPLGPSTPGGLPLQEVTLAQELSAAGYRAAALGKWHLGYSDWAYTPTERGFDSHYGFLSSGGIHYRDKTQTVGGNTYLDFRDNRAAVTDTAQEYSSILYKNRAIQEIQSHKANHPNKPLFMYYAMQNVHTPLDPNAQYTAPCSAVPNPDRRAYCAMVRLVDDMIAQVEAALDTAGMLSNTLFVFASDNGASPREGGSNYPLRGGKSTLYDGGVRTRAWISGNGIPDARKGSTWDGLMHITDWYPTLLHVAGRTRSSGCLKLDGVNVWDAIIGGTTSPRTSVFLNGHEDTNGDVEAGIITNGYKLLTHACGGGRGSVVDVPTGDTAPGFGCGTRGDYFFLTSDESESNNLIGEADHAGALTTVRSLLDSMVAEMVPELSSATDTNARRQAATSNAWTPWQSGGVTSDVTCGVAERDLGTQQQQQQQQPTAAPSASAQRLVSSLVGWLTILVVGVAVVL